MPFLFPGTYRALTKVRLELGSARRLAYDSHGHAMIRFVILVLTWPSKQKANFPSCRVRSCGVDQRLGARAHRTRDVSTSPPPTHAHLCQSSMRAATSSEAEAVHGFALLIHAKNSASFVTVAGLSTTDPSSPPRRHAHAARNKNGHSSGRCGIPLRVGLPYVPPDSERDRGQIHHPIEQPGSPG